jgi:hypothetical protein
MGDTIDREFFYEGWRAKWGKLDDTVFDNVEFLLSGFDASTVFDTKAKIAYGFGTMKRETNKTFAPVNEGYWLNPANRVGSLYAYYQRKNPGAIKTIFPNGRDGRNYLGRGFIQLTHDYNYKIYGNKIRVNLFENPDEALKPENAFKVMEAFCDGKMERYFTKENLDFFNARKIINGLDAAREIEKNCKEFFEIIRFV